MVASSSVSYLRSSAFICGHSFWHCEQFKTPKEDCPQINADERRLRKAKCGVRSRPDAIAVLIGIGHNTVDLPAWDKPSCFRAGFLQFLAGARRSRLKTQ